MTGRRVDAHAASLSKPTKPVFRPVCRWDFLAAVTTLRKDFGLTPNDLAVFRALLSFLPAEKTSGNQALILHTCQLVVFASNAAISTRANDLDERMLRRAFSRLEDAGLLRRKNSATGKRFPVRIQGDIVDAYGLDLAPGFLKAHDIFNMRDTRQAEDETRRALRAEIFADRRVLMDRLSSSCPALLKWLDEIGRILRRNISLDHMIELARSLRTALSFCSSSDRSADVEQIRTEARHPDRVPQEQPEKRLEPDRVTTATPTETSGLSAANGQYDRHIEAENIEKIKEAEKERTDTKDPRERPLVSKLRAEDDFRKVWGSYREIPKYIPYPPMSHASFQGCLDTLSMLSGLRPASMRKILSDTGWKRCLFAVDRLLERLSHGHNVDFPDAWARKLAQDPDAAFTR